MVRGLVQGVGFRPFIHRLATGRGLRGEVINRSDGVVVTLECSRQQAEQFAGDIHLLAPRAATIRSVEIIRKDIRNYTDFRITASRDVDNAVTEVSPDIAVCDECLQDMVTDEGRIDYPFINCTACGPRFSIVRALPYDRVNTTMAPFAMCPRCEREYQDIFDRRFHAQPVACNSCGPEYTLKEEETIIKGISAILGRIASRLNAGLSVAVKSTGGYNLMCDALNEEAVASLRINKQRDRKPFAVMFRDIGTLREYCSVSEEEETHLLSWRRPIMIVDSTIPLAPSVSSGLRTVGAMLPHMPFHHMLFRYISTPAVVVTSGNLSDEPIITGDDEAIRSLMPVTGCVVSYNREISNRVDDSVIRVINGLTGMVRRARGFAPRPVEIACDAEGILATGAEQKNTLCIGKGRQALPGQYNGDVNNVATYDFYRETYILYSSLFRFTPSYVVCDMHPGYLTSRFAGEISEEMDVPLLKVQHHYAHAASVMAEHQLGGKVIGVIMDGTGYGTDGNIWGSEFLVATGHTFERFAHFDYMKMPGGDAAVREPWRMALSCLLNYSDNNFDYRSLRLFQSIDERKFSIVHSMIEQDINAPLTCGAGRFFDAVSALLMLCPENVFDSEAPMRLESAIAARTDEYYPFSSDETIGLGDMFRSIVSDIDRVDTSMIAIKFHNTIARIILDVCMKIKKETGLKRVVLSGGVFQNRYLLGKALTLLSERGFTVFTNHQVPANDGGISLGQLFLAAERRSSCA
jgi:hydrogenase maturation protein HypF